MKNNKRSALILTTEKKSKLALDKIIEILKDKGFLKYLTDDKYFTFISCSQGLPDGLTTIQIKDYFPQYTYFDNFLLEMVDKGFNSLSDLGLVLGHYDNDGFFWTDYSTAQDHIFTNVAKDKNYMKENIKNKLKGMMKIH